MSLAEEYYKVSHPLSLSQQLKALEQLQELDLKIDQLKKSRSSLPASLKTLDAQLQKGRAGVDAKGQALNEMDKLQKQTRAALDLGRDRLTRSNGRLEAVQKMQEYQANSKEIEQLKKMNASLEEQLKKGDEEAEVVRKEQAHLLAEVEKVQKERDSQAQLLSTEGGKLDQEITNLTQQRAQFVSQVDARTLANYDRVRVARNGVGIVPADGGRCKGCNMVVPPQLFNEICKFTAVYSCPSCHRILFVPVAPGTSSGSAN